MRFIYRSAMDKLDNIHLDETDHERNKVYKDYSLYLVILGSFGLLMWVGTEFAVSWHFFHSVGTIQLAGELNIVGLFIVLVAIIGVLTIILDKLGLLRFSLFQ